MEEELKTVTLQILLNSTRELYTSDEIMSTAAKLDEGKA